MLAVTIKSKKLVSENLDISDPGDFEVQVKNVAIEVNRIDMDHVGGVYALANSKGIPGISGVGYISGVGKKVKGLKEGDLVAYLEFGVGAYSHIVNVKADRTVCLPAGIDAKVVASCFAKSMAVHMLVFRAYRIQGGTGVLIHSASGRVGRLLAEWCRDAGAYVIGSVGSDEKRGIASAYGCHTVINYKSENLVEEVKKITAGYGVHVAYDGIGSETFEMLLDCIVDIGSIVQYGNVSGMLKTLSVSKVAQRSLLFTRPSLLHYKARRMELIMTAEEIFGRIGEGKMAQERYREFKLQDAESAHSYVSDKANKDFVILVP